MAKNKFNIKCPATFNVRGVAVPMEEIIGDKGVTTPRQLKKKGFEVENPGRLVMALSRAGLGFTFPTSALLVVGSRRAWVLYYSGTNPVVYTKVIKLDEPVCPIWAGEYGERHDLSVVRATSEKVSFSWYMGRWS